MRDHRRISITVLAAVLCAATACSSGGDDRGLHAEKDRPLVIGLDDLLARAGGSAAVAVGNPQHGRIERRGDGALVYTPQAGYTGADSITVTTTEAVRLYTTDIPVLGQFGGVTVQGSGFGSALTPVPGSADEFYGLTDRGPNADGPKKNEKILPTPNFAPRIGKFELRGTKATLISTIELKNRAGVPFNGLVDTAAATGETMRGLDGAPLPPTDHGLDPEGLVALPDGTFWVSDEYGPFLVHFDATGTELERLAPGSGLPQELSLRTPNQGMEGLTVTPDGKTLVGVIQSGLQAPGAGPAREVPMTRIVTVDIATRAVREFVYPLEDPQSQLAVSEITATGPSTFVVDERDGKLAPKANKKLWTIDLSGATDVGPRSTVPGAHYDPKLGLLVDGKPLEVYVGAVSTADGIDALRRAGITPVAKKSNLDLAGLVTGLAADGGFFGHDKIEGVATRDGGKTLYIANDSDFGLAGSTGEQPPFGLKAKTLPNGVQDAGEILLVDTAELPAATRTATVPITVR
ncbi:esterase-like activity of phytase family protein [Nocardia sp. CDC159]|uniref:Esterase-like activity of phytase family protein n=1 Tax=Nocardia pulmonis TaxID=2951408 RepID=A0A9X2IWN3_9NOCA|nr:MULTISPECIES: esterase-like activity of phytase family protein [Nocardia]MCM6773739.1 esterase-like activity of phytase family protein [Nocardia pulmonis]MCM6786626.1 esterase-like activity of phytase family protein [Nocardia sp. CDC159]